MAYGTQSTPCRRESREHGPTLGRIDAHPLGLSTGPAPRGQSEDEEVEEVEEDEPGALAEELPDDESEVEDEEDFSDVVDDESEPEVDAVAGVEDVEVARLSVR